MTERMPPREPVHPLGRSSAGVLLEVRAQLGDDEVVVVVLGEPRDADRTDHARAVEADRHHPAVGGELARVEPRVRVEVFALRAERLADEQRGPAVALDDAVLAVEPAVVVGARAGQRGVEHPLRPEPDRDRDRMPRSLGRRAQATAELPRIVEGEALELQLGLFGDEPLQQSVTAAAAP